MHSSSGTPTTNTEKSNVYTYQTGTSDGPTMYDAEFITTSETKQAGRNNDSSIPGPAHHHTGSGDARLEEWEVPDARPILPRAAFFMGDLRDGLPMLNMQAAFLISAKNFTEKEVGILFFVFGMAQFLCMAPAGYFLDYSNNKLMWVIWAGFMTSLLTVVTALTASPQGDNMGLMILWKFIQGGMTAVLHPGFNGITLGIVGSTGFTHQVSRNRMMNHIGTALVVSMGSLIAYFLYPNIGALFVVSPLAAIGMYFNLVRIKPTHVNRDAARCLIIESPTMTEYEHMDEVASVNSRAVWQEVQDESDGSDSNRASEGGDHSAPSYMPPDVLSSALKPPSSMANFEGDHASTQFISMPLQPHKINEDEVVDSHSAPQDPEIEKMERERSNSSKTSHVRSYGSGPSFNFGWGRESDPSAVIEEEKPQEVSEVKPLRAQTPVAVLMDPTLGIFVAVVFFFHLANSSVLPLVMQSLALQDPQAGILLSGLCILIAQGFMSYFAKICGDYSPTWGRKNLILIGLSALTVRCFLLTVLVSAQDQAETEAGANIIKALILSTQFLDSVGAGIFGTLHILVTNDISGGTGRFSLMLGVTTGAMCLGGTVSGYIGQAIAQDYGYPFAFTSLGIMSLIPLFTYVFCMPETLPDYAKPKKRRRRLIALLKKLNDHRRSLARRANPFRRRNSQKKADLQEQFDPKESNEMSSPKVPSRTVELV